MLSDEFLNFGKYTDVLWTWLSKININMRPESCDYYSSGNRSPSGQYPLLSHLWQMMSL